MNTNILNEFADLYYDTLGRRSLGIFGDNIGMDLVNEEPPYGRCWDAGEMLGQKIWIPGFDHKKMSGVRTLRTIAYILCHPDAEIRGKRLIQCCPNPYCVNPAHTYIVSNRNKLYDQIYLGIQSEEEWDDIRGEILHQIQLKQADEVSLEFHQERIFEAYTSAQKRMTEVDKVKKDLMHLEMSNDMIFTRAVTLAAKSLELHEEFGTLHGFLERNQLKTAFYSCKKGTKDLIESIVPEIRTSELITKEEQYREICKLACRMYEDKKLLDAILKIERGEE